LAIAFLCVFSASTYAAAVKDNLLLNPGAEQGKDDLPSFWFEAAIPAEGLRMYRSRDYVHSGNFSLAISNTHKYDQTVCNNWAQSIMDVPAEGIVRLSAYLKTKDADSVNVCLQCWGLENNMLAFASTPVVRGDQDWILLYSEPVAVPSGTAKITVRAVLTGLGKAWFDDLAVVSVDMATVQDDQPECVVDSELAEIVEGEIIESPPITKDCMILSYMPEWAHGNVDNIAVADNDGGVRTLLAWPGVSLEYASDPNLLFLIALYSRKTTSKGPAGTLGVYEILEDWPEPTSWQTQPPTTQESAVEFDFVPGTGWKLFDITTFVRDRSQAQAEYYGLMLRFAPEDRTVDNWSGYAFVSREGLGQWLSRRPRLLIIRKQE
jgi:hypothetical protein